MKYFTGSRNVLHYMYSRNILYVYRVRIIIVYARYKRSLGAVLKILPVADDGYLHINLLSINNTPLDQQKLIT